jgi:hypothetical protein
MNGNGRDAQKVKNAIVMNGKANGNESNSTKKVVGRK